MIDLMRKYENLPTIMNYDDELMVMRDLISLGVLRSIEDAAGLEHVLGKIEESHQDNGVFEFENADAKLFVNFVDYLVGVKDIAPDIMTNHSNMIDTFKNPGFR